VKHVDEERLETDLEYRFGYVAEFMGFNPKDIEVIHGAAPLVAPLVPTLVDAVYDKLRTYDATWRHFVPRQGGYEGEVPENLQALTVDHEQIKFRKQHLGRYLERLVTVPYDTRKVLYLDTVGKIHTPTAGNPELNVPLVQMNALMGFVHDAINATILGFDIPGEAKAKVIRAFSKLLWIQNDLITRHYAWPNGMAPPLPNKPPGPKPLPPRRRIHTHDGVGPLRRKTWIEAALAALPLAGLMLAAVVAAPNKANRSAAPAAGGADAGLIKQARAWYQPLPAAPQPAPGTPRAAEVRLGKMLFHEPAPEQKRPDQLQHVPQPGQLRRGRFAHQFGARLRRRVAQLAYRLQCRAAHAPVLGRPRRKR
jgi:hypothetical protein